MMFATREEVEKQWGQPLTYVRVPEFIDATGTDDVAEELQQFLDSVPSGSEVDFGYGTFRLSRVVELNRYGRCKQFRDACFIGIECTGND